MGLSQSVPVHPEWQVHVPGTLLLQSPLRQPFSFLQVLQSLPVQPSLHMHSFGLMHFEYSGSHWLHTAAKTKGLSGGG